MVLLRFLIELYSTLIVINILISFFPEYRTLKVSQIIFNSVEFTCKPVRERLPQMPLDLSPIIVMIFLSLISRV